MWVRKQPHNKYRNKSCTCRQGHHHDSIKEGDYCNILELLRQSGDIKKYDIQKTFDLCIDGKKICAIRPDFLVMTRTGGLEVHEVKSYITMTPEWNIKRKMFEALYPDITYIVIK